MCSTWNSISLSNIHCSTSAFAENTHASSRWRGVATNPDCVRAQPQISQPLAWCERAQPGKLQRQGKRALHLSVSGDTEGIHLLHKWIQLSYPISKVLELCNKQFALPQKAYRSGWRRSCALLRPVERGYIELQGGREIVC